MRSWRRRGLYGLAAVASVSLVFTAVPQLASTVGMHSLAARLDSSNGTSCSSSSGSSSSSSSSSSSCESVMIVVTSPSPGATWRRGTSHTIRWQIVGGALGGTFDLTLVRTKPRSTDIHKIKDKVSGDQYTWNIPGGAAGDTYQVQVSSNADPSVEGTSAYFSLTAAK
jgi:hypothetical protein